MDQPTRKLLALIGSDACGAICERLEAAPATQTELAEELGLQGRDVAATLDQLLLVGLVGWRKEATEGRGRPAKIWTLVRAEELATLERCVREVRQRLLEAG